MMSPDETIILAGSNKQKILKNNICATGSDYTLYAFDIKNNSLKTYAQKEGYLNGITWKGDSKEYAIILLSCGGCYPSYMDAKIFKYDRNGTNEELLVEEKEKKINAFGWAPEGELIAFSIYGADYVGSIKTVNAWNHQVNELITSMQTEGRVDKVHPTVLDFKDWVVEK